MSSLVFVIGVGRSFNSIIVIGTKNASFIKLVKDTVALKLVKVSVKNKALDAILGIPVFSKLENMPRREWFVIDKIELLTLLKT